MEHPNFFDDPVYDSLLQRIEALQADSQPEWGSMSGAQMCAHCAEVTDVAGGRPLSGTPWYIKMVGRLIKKMVVSDRPYPRNSGTHPQYVMTDTADFEVEKTRLLSSLEKLKSAPEGRKHPLFGPMGVDEIGWTTFKHLDHHLTQFGV